jgi:uroporphyrinogen-III synthase
MRRVIVLRPEPAAGETVRRARALGLDAHAMPLFEVEPVAWDAPEPSGFDALLLTSANALRHGGEQLRQLRALPVHAVGEATAEAARAEGFDVASVGKAGVDRLLRSIAPELKLLHLCGEHRKVPDGARQEIVAVPVYRARERGVSLDGLSSAVALIHSPRAGRRFAELIGDRGAIAIAAISAAAAEAAGGDWADVAVAETPTDDALLALAARLCNTMRPT